MMTVFALADGPSWLEHEKYVPSNRFTTAMRLLAQIILQNVWPIDHYTSLIHRKKKKKKGIHKNLPF
jgi:hypothetical protein